MTTFVSPAFLPMALRSTEPSAVAAAVSYDQAVASMHNRAYSLALLQQQILVGAECGSATCGARYNRTARWTRRSPPVASLAPGGTTSYETFPVDSRAGFLTAALFWPGGPIQARWY